MKSESRAVCLRFAPPTAGSGEGSPWSHPLEASFPIVADRHVAVPVQPPTPSQTAAPGTLVLEAIHLAILCPSGSSVRTLAYTTGTTCPVPRSAGMLPLQGQ